MKKIIFLIFTLSIYSFCNAQDIKATNASETAVQVSYTCPMHPQIHSPKPGNCPICGMKLVKEKSKAVKQPVKKNTPTPETIPAKKTTQAPAAKQDNIPQQPVTYTCPMHPQIHSSKPGNCPICGMNLVKEKPKAVKEPVKKDPIQHQAHDTMMQKGDNMDGMHMDHQNMEAVPSNILSSIKTIEAKAAPRTVRYDLYIADSLVTFGKKMKRAIAVNGQIPMPTLTFTEGDTAEIYVHNNLKEETSLHWHGLFLPNRMDGVPYLTQMPIKPHSTYIYRFPIVQHGTHWYHSHSKLQEQIGMYGAFIMNKRKELDIPTIPVVISEWIDMKPEEVHRSLRAATDWFAIQKGSTQSYSEAIKKGHFKTKLTNEWKRMNAMDVSDVYYDNFLINGKNQASYILPSGSGEAVRLRIANAGASDYFWLSYAGGKITVVATDGNDVEPVEVDRLLIAVSETYDVIVTVPKNKQYEFLITPEDRTKSASLWLGSGEKIAAVKMPKLKYFAGMRMMNAMMDMQGNMIEMDGMAMQNQEMDMNTVMYPEITGEENPTKERMNKEMPMHDMHNMQHAAKDNMGAMHADSDAPDISTLNYGMLRSPSKTTLPGNDWKVLKFDLTGNMNRYVWSLDNKVVSEADKILIKKGENVRIILFNNSMMRHPMHLHGHDFRVLNGQGEYAPLKNVLDIMPMERDTIEFAATESGGDWFFHCHILYHMMSGMGRVFRYENSPVNPDLPDARIAKKGLNSDDNRFHLMGKAGIEYNGTDGEIMLSQTRWKLTSLWHLGYHDMHGYESETMLGRYLGRMQWWYPYIGFDYHFKMEGGPKNIFGNEDRNWFGQKSNKLYRKTVMAGVAYTLPLLFTADARVDGNGKFRFQLGREDIPITSRLRYSMMINTDKEYMAGFRYILTKYFSLSTHYDSDMGLGAGFTFTY
ncbi:MAG: multicopper oxidase domain-containing protein [Ferruginibacter sp.]